MSILTVRDIQGLSAYGNTVRIPSGHNLEIIDKLSVNGSLKLPTWTTSTRPQAPEIGLVGYNITDKVTELYDGTEWIVTGGEIAPDGSTLAKAAISGFQLVQDYPTKSNGLYWIKSQTMPQALRMYVDFVEDGGGYDFYAITNGISVSFITDTHSGVSLGLDLWEGRSPQCWRAASRAVAFFDNANFASYWQACGHVYKPAGGGNYTGCIMRSSFYAGNNCPDWRVKSGQRWWIRNTTHSEPNGDYSGNGFLQIYGGQIGNPFDINTNMGFNDGGAYSTGNRYLVSTNAKL